MGRDFNNALISFTKASQLNPYDHTLLNKIGASLSNLSNTAAAIETYSKALDRRPGYVRAWVNTGIAYAN